MRRDAGQGGRSLFFFWKAKAKLSHLHTALYILFKEFLDSSTKVSKRRLRAGGTLVLLPI